MEWLKRMATGEVPGYDVRPADRAIRSALRVEELAKLAIEATSRMPGAEPQAELATVVLDGQRPADVRIAAAEGLVRHVQSHGVALSAPSIKALIDLLPTLPDATLRAHVAAAVGVLQATTAQSGQRLQRYLPPLPKPAAAKPEEPPPPKPTEPMKDQ